MVYAPTVERRSVTDTGRLTTLCLDHTVVAMTSEILSRFATFATGREETSLWNQEHIINMPHRMSSSIAEPMRESGRESAAACMT